MTYHKHGGIHFLSIGRLRLQWSIANRAAGSHNIPQPTPLPKAMTMEEVMAYQERVAKANMALNRLNLAELYDGGEVPREVSETLSNPSYRNAMIDSGRGRLIR